MMIQRKNEGERKGDPRPIPPSNTRPISSNNSVTIYQSGYFCSTKSRVIHKKDDPQHKIFYLDGDLGSGKSHVTLEKIGETVNDDPTAKFLVVVPTLKLAQNHSRLLKKLVHNPDLIHSVKRKSTNHSAIQSFVAAQKCVLNDGGVIIITHALFNTPGFQAVIRESARKFIHIMDELDSMFYSETVGKFPYSSDFIMENFDIDLDRDSVMMKKNEYVIAKLSAIGEERIFSASDTILNQFLGDHLVNARMGSPVLFRRDQIERINQGLSKRTGANHQLNIASFQHPSLYTQFKESLVISGDFFGSMMQQIWKNHYGVEWCDADRLSCRLRKPEVSTGSRLVIFPLCEDNFSKSIRDKVIENSTNSQTYFDLAIERIEEIINFIGVKDKKIIIATNTDVDVKEIAENLGELNGVDKVTDISTKCHGLNDYSEYNIGIFFAALNQNPFSAKLLQDFDVENVDLANTNNREAIHQFAIRGNLRKYDSNEKFYLIAMDLRSSQELQNRYPGTVINDSFMIPSVDKRKGRQESTFDRNIYNAKKRFESTLESFMTVKNPVVDINEESSTTEKNYAQKFTTVCLNNTIDDSLASGSLRSPEEVNLDSSFDEKNYAQKFTTVSLKDSVESSALFHQVTDERRPIKLFVYDSIMNKFNKGSLDLSRTELFRLLKTCSKDRIVDSKHENKLFLTTTTDNDGRKKINAEWIHAITLDFDGGKATMKSVRKVLKKKRIYSAVLYETTSSDGREDPNRFRVVINLTRSMTPIEYGYVIKEVASWFDKDSGLDRGKLYETAIFYLPAKLSNSEHKPKFMTCYRDKTMIDTHCLDVDKILQTSKIIKNIKEKERKNHELTELYAAKKLRIVRDFNKVRSFTGASLIPEDLNDPETKEFINQQLYPKGNTKDSRLFSKLMRRVDGLKEGARSSEACSIAGAAQYLEDPGLKQDLYQAMLAMGIDKAASRSIRNYMRI